MVFIPKYRKKAIFGQIRKELGDVFRRLARQKESEIEEGHLMPDHVHMMISIPPKYAVSQVVGEERHPHCQGIRRSKTELRRSELLGKRVFRLDGRSG